MSPQTAQTGWEFASSLILFILFWVGFDVRRVLLALILTAIWATSVAHLCFGWLVGAQPS